MVGEDDNANIGYQVLVSNLRLELRRRHYLAVRFAPARRMLELTLRDLDTPGAAPQTATLPMESFAKLSEGAAPVVLGGISKRLPPRQWDGQIEALRIVSGRLSDDQLQADPARWKTGVVVWRATDPLGATFAWSGADAQTSEANAPARQAMSDLCQMLLTSNEFFYLH
ncbi:MAG: hypothetical protein ACYC67_17740 [Prosthecobacter sp.]